MTDDYGLQAQPMSRWTTPEGRALLRKWAAERPRAAKPGMRGGIGVGDMLDLLDALEAAERLWAEERRVVEEAEKICRPFGWDPGGDESLLDWLRGTLAARFVEPAVADLAFFAQEFFAQEFFAQEFLGLELGEHRQAASGPQSQATPESQAAIREAVAPLRAMQSTPEHVRSHHSRAATSSVASRALARVRRAAIMSCVRVVKEMNCSCGSPPQPKATDCGRIYRAETVAVLRKLAGEA